MYNVLVVDDDKIVRYGLKKMRLWGEYGFKISGEAADGYEALKEISSSHFDMAFVDIKMPRIDGIEFVKELKKNGSDLCVVFMSGYSDYAYVRQGIILGAFDYILKPVEEDKLPDLLSRTSTYLSTKKDKFEINTKLTEIINTNFNLSTFSKKEDKLIEKSYLYHKSPIIRNVSQYVFLHSDEKVSLEGVSKEIHFSSSYLGKLFKQKTGEGFTEYVTKVKMERAKALLQTGKYKNYEVSDMLSYGNVDYFCSLFKKYTGVTPIEFRQSANSNRKCE